MRNPSWGTQACRAREAPKDPQSGTVWRCPQGTQDAWDPRARGDPKQSGSQGCGVVQ